jgi:histidinol-phosphate aminotransferase
MFDLNKILRSNIKTLIPYSSARDEFKGKEGIFLDANENSIGSPILNPGAQISHLNRYPDPLQLNLKEKLSKIKGVPVQNIFLGNGSDEAIDILFRAFCNPGKDNVIICPPTYGMYEVSANINDVEVRKVNLSENFQLDIERISEATDENSKLIFICSPNNPTGNSIDKEDIEIVLNNFEGIVVIDEAYINFAKQRTFINELTEYPNLVILQTLSKAWGMAGLRVGLAFASQQITDVFNKIKPPYNINAVSQQMAIKALSEVDKVNGWIREIVAEREELISELGKFDFILKIYPSDANFILVKVKDAKAIYNYLVENSIIIRDRSKVGLCEGCLRITVGTKEENNKLIEILKKYKT